MAKHNEQWLIVEHADGRFEDKGFVEVSVQMPVFKLGDRIDEADKRHRLLAQCPRTDWKASVLLDKEDYKPNGGVVDALPVVHVDGTRDIWHVGSGARDIAIAKGWLKIPE